MKEKTKKELTTAFTGECKAHAKYELFSEVAEMEGKPRLSNIFKAIACSELVHVKNHLLAMGDIKNSKENLNEAIKSEEYEIEEAYPILDYAAKFQNEEKAERSIGYALKSEKIHRNIYLQAKELLDQGGDSDVEVVYICAGCGYTHVNIVIPDKCPFCKDAKDKFIEFRAQAD